MKKSSLPLVDLLLLLMVLFWGINFAVIKIALLEIPPLAFNALRFLGSALFFVLYYHFFIGDYGFVRKHFKKLLLLGFIGNALNQIFFILGIHFTTASNSSIMYSTVPMFVALLNLVFRFERVTRLTWVGIIVSFTGIVLVISTSGSGVGFSKSTVIGDVFILICAAFWAIFTVFAKPLIEETSSVKVVALTFIFGTVFIFPTGIPDFLAMNWSAVSWKAWWFLGYSFLFANVFAYIIWFYGVSKVGSVHTAILQNLVPVFAVVIAAVFLHEVITVQQVLGALCIIGGVTLTRFSLVRVHSRV